MCRSGDFTRLVDVVEHAAGCEGGGQGVEEGAGEAAAGESHCVVWRGRRLEDVTEETLVRAAGM